MMTDIDGLSILGNASVRVSLKVIVPSADEMAAHRAYLVTLHEQSKGRCVWLSLDSTAGSPALALS
jgi:hypothetical protein